MSDKKKKIKHIAIAGNIGVGKTSLTQLLSKHYKWVPQFEEIEHNPYIIDFYDDMQRWSFNLQVYFLNERLKQILEIYKGESVIIQDRTIYEDAYIFAPNLHDMGLMSSRDFLNYTHLFKTIQSLIKPPDLLIYLKASIPTLVNRIAKRGRIYEENIKIDYLNKLNDYYNNWIEGYREGLVLTIDCNKYDFTEKKEDLSEIISIIESSF